MNKERHLYKYCPICGFDLDPDGVEKSELEISYMICDCCGCEFGYDDNSTHRENWIKDGYPWFGDCEKPKNWNPKKQLNRADYSWKTLN